MNKKRPPEPMLVHGVSIYYRGEAHWISETVTESMPLIEKFVWDNDVFYTDKDPLYVFADYRLIYEYRGVDHVKYTDEDGVTHQRRSVILCDAKGMPMETFAFTRSGM